MRGAQLSRRSEVSKRIPLECSIIRLRLGSVLPQTPGGVEHDGASTTSRDAAGRPAFVGVAFRHPRATMLRPQDRTSHQTGCSKHVIRSGQRCMALRGAASGRSQAEPKKTIRSHCFPVHWGMQYCEFESRLEVYMQRLENQAFNTGDTRAVHDLQLSCAFMQGIKSCV
jgi:hypothetical protein